MTNLGVSALTRRLMQFGAAIGRGSQIATARNEEAVEITGWHPRCVAVAPNKHSLENPE